MMTLLEMLATTLAAPPATPPATPPTAGPAAGPADPAQPALDAKPVVQVIFIVMGLTIASIVLVAGLMAMVLLRRSRRDGGPSSAPTPTPHVDAWAEAGRRAHVEPEADQAREDQGDERG